MSKELSELIIQEDCKYTSDHEWAKQDGDAIAIGISDYAQDQLGDIVFVELPEVGTELGKGDEFGSVESTKAVSELYMPVGGKVIAINEGLEDSPELVNNEPYGGGWMIKVEASDPSELETLMNADAYLNMLKGQSS